jgi:hypothetical protein
MNKTRKSYSRQINHAKTPNAKRKPRFATHLLNQKLYLQQHLDPERVLAQKITNLSPHFQRNSYDIKQF